MAQAAAGARIDCMKNKAVVTQLFRLNVEPRVIDRLARIASRTGEPKTRLARRLFTDAVLAYKPTKNGTGS